MVCIALGRASSVVTAGHQVGVRMRVQNVLHGSLPLCHDSHSTYRDRNLVNQYLYTTLALGKLDGGGHRARPYRATDRCCVRQTGALGCWHTNDVSERSIHNNTRLI